jgi:hypothetical protein
MTRINAGIKPIQLIDAHLFAEYRELKRIPNTINSGKAVVKNIPNNFTLGTGHVKWFYNKLKYLHNRSNNIYAELLRRNYIVEDYSNCFENLPQNLYNDWDDTNAKPILIERITQRLITMKNLKYYKEPIQLNEAISKLNTKKIAYIKNM